MKLAEVLTGRGAALGVWVMLGLAAPAVAQETDNLDRRVRQLMQQAEVPGVAVLVVLGDSVALEQSWGVADPATGEPMSADVVLRAGSLVSILNGLAAAQLAHADAVSLQAPVGQYLDGLLEPVDQVTLKQLLAGTAGLAQTFVRGPPTQDDLDFAARWLTPLDVVAPPGALVSASRTAPILAARALEAAGGASYPEVIRSQVLEPLGMTRSTLRHERALELGLAPGYGFESPESPAMTRLDPAADSLIEVPRHGLFTSPRDLARLSAALLRRGVVDGEQRLPSEVVEAVMTPLVEVPPGGPEAVWRGLGTRFNPWEDRPEIRVSSSEGGHSVLLRLIPRNDVAVIMAANGSGTILSGLSHIAELMIRSMLQLPEATGPGSGTIAPPRPIELAHPEQLTGTFRNGAETLEIGHDADGLYVQSGDLRLSARLYSDKTLRVRVPDGRVAMVLRVVQDQQGTLYLYYQGRAFRRVEDPPPS